MATNLKQRFITVEEYHQMIEAGILEPEDRVELIRGQLVEMSPIGSKHSGCVNAILRTLHSYPTLIAKTIISIQSPVIISATSQPEPDLLLLNYREDCYSNSHPTGTDVLLALEVSSTSYRKKGPLYAEAQIPEYWIVDLDRRCIEAYREPVNGQYTKMDLFLPDTEAYLYGFELHIPLDRLIP